MDRIIFLTTILIFLYFTSVFSAPKSPPIPYDPDAPIQTAQDIIDWIGGILEMFVIIFWLLSIVAFFYAGYLFLTSGGSEEKLGKAKKMLLYGVIAVVLGIMAFGLPFLIQNFLRLR